MAMHQLSVGPVIHAFAKAPSGWEVQPGVGGRADFRIDAAACPQLLLRMLGLLAQQGRIPDRAFFELREGNLAISLTATGLPRHRAEVIADKMRSLVGAHSVELAWAA